MKKTNVKVIFSVLAGILILICLGVLTLNKTFEEKLTQRPLRSFTVTILPNQRILLFKQLENFSVKNQYQYDLTDYGGQGEHFLVSIVGKDVEILVVEVSETLDVYTIRFFNPLNANTTLDEKTLDRIVQDLLIFVNEIPNVKISEE